MTRWGRLLAGVFVVGGAIPWPDSARTRKPPAPRSNATANKAKK